MSTQPDLHSRIVKRGWYWDCKAEGREPDAEVRARLAQISQRQPEDAETQAKNGRPSVNASAIRGMVFGIPLAIAMWIIPIVTAGVSRNWWLGALAGLLEVVAMAAAARLFRKEH